MFICKCLQTNFRMRIIFIILGLLINFTGFSQKNPVSYSASELKSFAENAERSGDIISAGKFYKLYFERKNDDYKTCMKLADCMYQVKNYELAYKYYSIVCENAFEEFPVSAFYIAKIHRIKGQYQEADIYLQKFHKAVKSKDIWDDYKKEYKQEVESNAYIPRLLDSVQNVEISALDTSVNKFQADFAPFFVDENTILYTSLKSDKTVEYEPEENEILPSKKIFLAKRTNGQWKTMQELPSVINIEGINTSNGVYSPDGKRFIFTRCSKNWKFENICKLYESVFEDQTWQTPTELGFEINSDEYSCAQAAFGINSESGNPVLYFASNNPKGKGGWDIWYTEFNLKKQTYGQARNLGSTINTEFDDITPFYDMKNRKLFFSSDGIPGMGGLDVFVSSGETRNWTVPQNAGIPINSGYDDIYYTYFKDPGNGLFVSNRQNQYEHSQQTCCYDIFSYKKIEYKYISLKGEIHKTEIIDESDAKSDSIKLDGVIVSLFKKDLAKNDYVLLGKDTTDKQGKYFFDIDENTEYKIVAQKDSFIPNSFSFTTKTLSKSETLNTDLGMVKEQTEQVKILNIYYATNKYELLEEGQKIIDTTLLKLMLKYPDIIVEVSSHTDDVGTITSNNILSQNRANGVAEYLIKKGISPERVVSKGYGESKPIARNKFANGDINVEGRQKNRRTEFKIIGTLNKDTKISYE